MNENDFFRQQQAAVERMREMNARAAGNTGGGSMPPVPPFVKVDGAQNRRRNSENQNIHEQSSGNGAQNNSHQPEADCKNEKTPKKERSGNSLFGGLDLPFLDILGKDTDITLIIGLLLILMSEKADKKLLFALIYILM